MSGGVGFSFFEVELTSEHVPVAGEGGVGYSWFTIDLTSDDVPVEPGGARPPYGGLNVVKRVRRRIEEDVFEGRFHVVHTEIATFNGLVLGYQDAVFEGSFTQVESSVQEFEASFGTSTIRMRIQREEEELLCLMD